MGVSAQEATILFRELLIGGRTIEQATLIRFYVLHVFVLPVLLVILVSVHFWRIRKDGGLAAPAGEPLHTALSWPHLLLRELVVLVAVPAGYSDRLSTIVNTDRDPTGSADERWNTMMSALGQIARRPLLGYGLGNSVLKSRLNEVIDVLGIGDFSDRLCDKLSTGQKQRVSIAAPDVRRIVSTRLPFTLIAPTRSNRSCTPRARACSSINMPNC